MKESKFDRTSQMYTITKDIFESVQYTYIDRLPPSGHGSWVMPWEFSILSL
jgi:hypothetical protein